MTLARIPLVPLAVALGTGVAVGPALPAAGAWGLWGAGLAVAATSLVLGRLLAGSAAVLLGVVALGALCAAPPSPPPDDVARLAMPWRGIVEGRVAEAPVRYAPDRVRVRVEVERTAREPRSGVVQLTLYGEGAELSEGDRIAAEVRLARATGFRNPGGFDYAEHLAREGIAVVGTARTERVAIVEDVPAAWHARLRQSALDAIARALPPASAALMGGLLLGERRDLPREIDDAFRRAGMYHVLAVSGFNVALVGGTMFALLALAGAGRRGAALGALLVVVGFVCVVGPQASVLRAGVMGVLVFGALLLDRESSVLNGLALAALAILAVRPGDLHDPGFQLSFAATCGIVVAPLPRGLVAGSLGVSLAAQLAVLPVGLVHFNQINTVGPLSNLAAVPLAGIATVLGLLAVALSFASETAAAVLFDASWPLLLGLRAAAALTAAIPGALVHAPAPGWPAVAAYVAALGLALAWWRLRDAHRRAARLAAGAAGVLLAAAVALEVWPLVRPADGWLRVIVLDVGQGDAIIIESPDGRAALVDAGPGGPGRIDAGERVVAPVLWNRGLMRLAAVATTHDDLDHAGGMASIRRLFAVGETWTSETFARGPRWLGPVLVASPAPPSDAPLLTRNERALVLRLDHGLASILLASDIPDTTERALVASRASLAASVLKVGHHGSRGSSSAEFLGAVAPTIAVISVGTRNTYGHPAREVLARLAAAGASVYRTDLDGAVIVETDGRTLQVRGWASGRLERRCLDPEAACEPAAASARMRAWHTSTRTISSSRAAISSPRSPGG